MSESPKGKTFPKDRIKREFEVQAGSSSEDIRLKDSFTVTENVFITGKTRAFYALGEIK